MLIGVDFAGTTVQAGLVADGRVRRAASAALEAGASPEQALETLVQLVKSLAPRPEVVGVAIPGEVNADGRCWRLPNLSGFEGVAIAEQVSRRLGCPVAMENRATTAALAEQLYGHGRSHPSFLVITLGTGIGGGLVLGHQLYPGANGFGAEVGHLKVSFAADAPVCGCGQRGCVEAFAGAKALARHYRAETGTELEPAQLASAASAGEPAAVQAFEAAGRALGRALSITQNLLDLNAIVLGCSASVPFSLLEKPIRKELRQHCFAPPLANVPLLESALGEQAVVVGAAYLMTL